MKRYVEGLTAIHDGEDLYRGTYANFGIADKPSYPRAEHPVVRTHPVTGRKALYVNRGFTKRIVGVAARREFGHPELSLGPRGKSAVPVPVPLAGKLHRVLGQPLRAASRHVGLLAAHPLRPPCHGPGRQAGMTMANALTSPLTTYLEHLERGRARLPVQPRSQRGGVLSARDLPVHRQRSAGVAGQQGDGHGARDHRGSSSEGRPVQRRADRYRRRLPHDEPRRGYSRRSTCGSACG